nr:MAG: HAD family hydrolase [Hyphomicrobiales bacterium]
MGGAAIFDLDRTLTKRGTWGRFIAFANAGHPAFWMGTPVVAVQAIAYKMGLATRLSVKEKSIAMLLANLSRDRLEGAAEDFAEREVNTGLRAKARSVIEAHRAQGDALVIASAAAELVVAPIARRLGIDQIICTRLRWTNDGRLSPELDGPNCYGSEKLNRIRETWGAPHAYKTVTAYSDHISDLGLLQWADRGVAVNPSKALLIAARRDGIEIVNWDR